MPRYAISVVTNKSLGTMQTDIRHAGFVVDAVSPEEAEGKALAIGRKLYPPDEGWKNHHATVSDTEPRDAATIRLVK